ncbi:MAG: ParB/RepB/Spo0J family partition protein, partial [Leptolyngbyaceae cyanobacterium bins.302]|nr:ParB/RepB/Spo0J family partition protein [Leptolyngbyaceae cyanobacterium bins.302]
MSSRLQGLTGLLAVEATVETDTVEPDLMGLVTPQAAEEVAVSGNAPVLIPLSKIRKSPFQPRSFFNYEKIQKMADKFRQYREAGIRPKTVILVRPVPGEDAYELVFGEQRKIAHEKANYTDVLAFVDDTITDEEARELALTENLLREDLNPVEKTEGILNLAAIKLGTSPEGVRQLLDKAANQRKQHTDNVTRTEQWKTLEAFFHELPDKITPESFRTNYLPLLKLPSDVLEVLHQGKIEYTKAK